LASPTAGSTDGLNLGTSDRFRRPKLDSEDDVDADLQDRG
jgi:hypothetical protein